MSSYIKYWNIQNLLYFKVAFINTLIKYTEEQKCTLEYWNDNALINKHIQYMDYIFWLYMAIADIFLVDIGIFLKLHSIDKNIKLIVKYTTS